MFRKRQSRRNELEQLRATVARLEAALAEAIQASDALVNDQTITLAEPAPRVHADAAFAVAWRDFETGRHQLGETFFDVAEEDQRARRWLLANR